MTGASAILAGYVAGAELSAADRAAAADSRERTRIAVAAGRATSGARLAAAIVAADGAPPSSPATRAWLDAAAATASALDDTIEYGSAGATVWPALEALAGDAVDAAGAAALVEAGGVGLRAALALWTAGRYPEAERGFSGSTVFGVLAAAAACARYLGLSVDRTASALAIAASQAGGLGVDDGTDARMLRTAAAARDGLQAALLARDGFAGAPDMFEGRQGFGEAFFGLPLSPLTGLADALDSGSLAGLHGKAVPGHDHHQRPVAALGRLLGQHPGREVREVRIEGVPPTSDGNRFALPTTPAQAARSLRHALAVTLRSGTVSSADLEHPLPAGELDRIVVRSAPRWDPRLAEPSFVAGEIRVEFADGGHATVSS